MEVDTRVAVWFRFHIRLEMEVLEWFVIAYIEDVASLTIANQRAVFDFPTRRIFIHLPSIQILPVVGFVTSTTAVAPAAQFTVPAGY